MASVSKFDFEFGAWTDARGAWDEDDIPDELEAFPLTRLSLGMWKARSHGGLRAGSRPRAFRVRGIPPQTRRPDPRRARVRARQPAARQTSPDFGPLVPVRPRRRIRARRGAGPGTGSAPETRRARAAPVPDGVGARDAPRASTDDAPWSATTAAAFTPGASSGGAHASGSRAAQHVVLTYEITHEDVVGLDYVNPLCVDGRIAIEARRVTKRAFSNLASALAFSRRARRRRAPRIRGGERRAFHRAKIRRRSTPSQIRAEV